MFINQAFVWVKKHYQNLKGVFTYGLILETVGEELLDHVLDFQV